MSNEDATVVDLIKKSGGIIIGKSNAGTGEQCTKDNLQDGFGVHIWYEDKGEQKYLRDRYVGEWKNGTRNGYGRFYYSNGSIYEGYWVNNQKEGFGIFYYQDRTKHFGNFRK